MRLNRVLLLAAVINIMIFAMVFTISCSGDEGKNGRDGKSCSIDKDSDGKFHINCEGGYEGTFEGGGQGAAGEKGEKGEKGADGKNGEGCTLGDKVGSVYQIICAGEVKGSLEGCDISTISEFELIIKCNGTTVNLCATKIFDDSKEFCDAGEITDKPTEFSSCGDAEVKYDPRTQYCGYASEAAMNDGEATVLNMCGKDGKPNDENQTEWKDEYCRFMGAKAENAKVSDETCGSAKAKINENSWKTEYCGYASANAVAKTVQKGLCDDSSKGPNEEGFGRGYCEASKLTGKTVYSEAICGTSGKPNDGKWKSEYCGYENKNNTTRKVYTGVCDFSVSGTVTAAGNPTQGAHSEGFNEGYCQANKLGITTYTDEDFCNDGVGQEAKNRMNEGTWKAEYCGVDSKGVATVYVGACDTREGGVLVGPNSEEFNSGYCRANREDVTSRSDLYCDELTKKLTVNKDKWQGQYCNYDNKVGTKACDQEDSGEPTGADKESKGGGFCTADLDHEKKYTKYVSADDESYLCGTTKLNVDGWKGQYCGYSTISAANPSVITPSSANGGSECALLKPNEDMPQGANAAEKTLNFEYCTVDIDGNMDLATPGDNSCKTKLNEGSWKGEYCFEGGTKSGKGTCNGGTIADVTKSSTDAQNIRCVRQCLGTNSLVYFDNSCTNSCKITYVNGGQQTAGVCRCAVGYTHPSSIGSITSSSKCRVINGATTIDNSTSECEYPKVVAGSNKNCIDAFADAQAITAAGLKVGTGDAAATLTCVISGTTAEAKAKTFWFDIIDKCVGPCDAGKAFTSSSNKTCVDVKKESEASVGDCIAASNGICTKTKQSGSILPPSTCADDKSLCNAGNCASVGGGYWWTDTCYEDKDDCEDALGYGECD